MAGRGDTTDVRYRLPQVAGVNDRKAYPLRINAVVIEAMQRWSDDELRSLNAQIEYVLRDALRRAGRLKAPAAPTALDDDNEEAPQ